MVAMGGNATAARKLLKRIKDKKGYDANPEPAKIRSKMNYGKNPEPAKERARQDYFSKSSQYGPSFPCIVCHELHWRGNTVVVAVDDIDQNFLCTD
jgi:hypothetical protein